MSGQVATLILTRAEVTTVLAALLVAKDDGWYYGNKAQWDKRLQHLIQELSGIRWREQGR